MTKPKKKRSEAVMRQKHILSTVLRVIGYTQTEQGACPMTQRPALFVFRLCSRAVLRSLQMLSLASEKLKRSYIPAHYSEHLKLSEESGADAVGISFTELRGLGDI